MDKMNRKTMDKKKALRKGSNCVDCGRCCQFGSGFLAENDVKNIAKHLNVSEKKLKEDYLEEKEVFGTKALRPKFPKPYGPCIFYDKDKHCMIHPVKPLLCKISNCKEDLTEWFYRNYLLSKKDISKEEWRIREEVKNGR